MKKADILRIACVLASMLCQGSSLFAQFGIGADVMSRYIFRGSDFGNTASIQPTLNFSMAGLEIGAWGSYAITADGAGVNENDLYITYSQGPLALVVTDYYFPESNEFFNYDNRAAVHILEAGASYEFGQFTLVGYYNFTGDAENSFYSELGFTLPTAGTEVQTIVFLGLGDGIYATDSDLQAVNLGITVMKDSWQASYILNPDKETNYLVFGKSF